MKKKENDIEITLSPRVVNFLDYLARKHKITRNEVIMRIVRKYLKGKE